MLRIPERRESQDTPLGQDRLLSLGNWLPLPENNYIAISFALKISNISYKINLENLLYSKKIILIAETLRYSNIIQFGNDTNLR